MATRRDQVGVRELRQNLSKYLARVLQGETLEVCDRGRPVALLRPLPAEQSARLRLVAEGRLIAAGGSLRNLEAPVRNPELARRIAEALEEVREDRL
jgi:prevent-host-death family protein